MGVDTKKRGFWRHWPWWLAGLLLAPVGLFLLASFWVDRQRLPAELVTPPALPGADATTTATIPATPTRPALDPAELAAIHSHDDYFAARRRHDPALAGTYDLYRELKRRYEAEKIEEGSYAAQGHWSPIRGGPLPPELTAWLDAHADFIDLARHYAESEPRLPMLNRAERAALNSGMTSFPHDGNGGLILLNRIGFILAADGARRLAAGDAAGAERDARAVLRLARDFLGDATLIGPLIGFAEIYIASGLLTIWAAQAPADAAVSPETLVLLDDLARARLGRTLATRMLEDEYLANRAAAVRAANGDSWKAPIYGWDMWEKQIEKRKLHIGDWEIKNYGVYLAASGLMIINKHNAPAYLREYDAAWRELLTLSQSDYRTLHDRGAEHWSLVLQQKMSRLNMLRRWTPNTLEVQMRGLSTETRLNMVRSALRLRRDTAEAAPPAATKPLPPDSPWRDPFTEQPFHVETLPATDHTGTVATSATATTTTLIWSLGPDLEDQHGALAYDPSNGTVSAGDISIQVPRAAEMNGKGGRHDEQP